MNAPCSDLTHSPRLKGGIWSCPDCGKEQPPDPPIGPGAATNHSQQKG